MSVTVGEMFQKVQENPRLRAALKDANDRDSYIAAFAEAGLTVTPDDLAKAKAAMETGELSDADLERVAGGAGSSSNPSPHNPT
jgi:predicted ribosomally synthesized peptide with nif11-like leader